MEVKEEKPPKRIKTQQHPEEKKDRISSLPDGLIIDEILPRLESTKYAIRTGILSKRWRHLWPSVSCLHFTDNDFKEYSFSDDKPLPDFYMSVDKTIAQCQYHDLIENILSGSPILDTLTLEDCCGYVWLDITSKSVKNLVLCGYDPEEENMDLDDVIEINAPYISSLEICGIFLLWKILLGDVSSLVKAELNYTKLGYDETTRKVEREEMLKRLVLRLRHVKELKIGRECYTAFSRLEAKGFNFPSNLKVAKVDHPLYDTDDSREIGDASDNDSSVGDTGSALVAQLKA